MNYEGEAGYLDLLNDIKDLGRPHNDRTGTGTRRMIGQTMRFDLSNNSIPMFTTKKVFWKGVVIELLWFLSGQTNVNFLKNHKVNIWNEWANEDGSLGPTYGEQMRFQASTRRRTYNSAPYENTSNMIDPLVNFINQLKDNPDSRRHIISLWNAPLISEMKLPPCHGVTIQASVIDGGLHLEMYQRSCDMFLGVPFNVASYSLFTHMIAKECGLKAVEFIWHGHDVHIYDNHIEAVNTQLGRAPKIQPTLELDIPEGKLMDYIGGVETVESLSAESIMNCFKLIGYDPDDTIKASVAI